MMQEELKQYQVEPEGFWTVAQMMGMSGYDAMGLANKKGWREIPAWGKEGLDLGSWPLVMIYHRNMPNWYELAYYVEGDVVMYSCPSRVIRNQVTDELAFFHWKHQGEEWVKDYESLEQLPDELRGPYRAAQANKV